MIHSTVIINVPRWYWTRLYPNWCGLNDKEQRECYRRHIDDVEHDMSLPGLRVNVMLVHKAEGQYTVERVRIPWSYRLWWLLNGKKWMEANTREKEVAISKFMEHERRLR
jgi:hypothetical protein